MATHDDYLPLAEELLAFYRENYASEIEEARFPDFKERGIPLVPVRCEVDGVTVEMDFPRHFLEAVASLMESAAKKLEEMIMLLREDRHFLVTVGTRAMTDDLSNLILLLRLPSEESLEFFLNYLIFYYEKSSSNTQDFLKHVAGMPPHEIQEAQHSTKVILFGLKSYRKEKGISDSTRKQYLENWTGKLKKSWDLVVAKTRGDTRSHFLIHGNLASEFVHNIQMTTEADINEGAIRFRDTMKFNSDFVMALWYFVLMLILYDEFFSSTFADKVRAFKDRFESLWRK